MKSAVSLNLVVGVDDTGSEGQTIESRSVDKDRQTLVAAIVGREELAQFNTEWISLVDELKAEFSVNEFHASKLWGGAVLNAQVNKAAKKKAEKIILDAFEKASKICIDRGVAFVVQTVHSETFKSLVRGLDSIKLPQPFTKLVDELTKPKEDRKLAALLLLSRVVLKFARQIGQGIAPGKSHIDIDVEWWLDKSPDLLSLSQEAANVAAAGFRTSPFHFVDSDQSSLVQAADFAAYVLNRHVYFMANRKAEHAAVQQQSQGYLRAKSLLMRTQGIVPLMLNIGSVKLRDVDIHSETYDSILDTTRFKMGLGKLDYK